MYFIDENNKNIVATNFIEIWSKRYYQYTSVTDNYYYDIVQEIEKRKDAGLILPKIGAWKTNSLSTNKSKYGGNQEFYRCKCDKPSVFYLTGMWKEGTSSGFAVWLKLSERLYKDIHRIVTDSEDEKIINEISEMKFMGPKKKDIRFGKIYAFTYLHFLAPDKYFILDKFVKIALEFLTTPAEKPSLPFSKEMNVNDFKGYNKYNELIKAIQIESKSKSNRDVDKALWSFGHWLKDQKEKKEKDVCCKI